MKNKISCAIYIKSNQSDVLKSKLEHYCGEDLISWSGGKIDNYSKLFRDMFKINIPLKEENATPPTTDYCYCEKNVGNDCVRDHNHLNGVYQRSCSQQV